MERAPIVVVLDGTFESAEAVRWAAWQSQETRTPLHLVHAYPSVAAPAQQDAEFRAVHESWQRSLASRWLREAFDESPALPYGLLLLVLEGDLETALERTLRPGGLLVLAGPSRADQAASVGLRAGCPVVLVPARDTVRRDLRPDDALPRSLTASPAGGAG